MAGYNNGNPGLCFLLAYNFVEDFRFESKLAPFPEAGSDKMGRRVYGRSLHIRIGLKVCFPVGVFGFAQRGENGSYIILEIKACIIRRQESIKRVAAWQCRSKQCNKPLSGYGKIMHAHFIAPECIAWQEVLRAALFPAILAKERKVA